MHDDQHDMPDPGGDADGHHAAACRRHHLPALHAKALGQHIHAAKDFIANKPATLSATGGCGFIASGHTHGQSTWATVTLAGLVLTAETLQKIFTGSQ